MKLPLALVLCGGCHLVFELGPSGGDPGVDGGPPVACTPGERVVLPGTWQGGAVDGEGTMYVGYQETASQRLFVQAVDPRGDAIAIPRAITEGPPNSGFDTNLRLFAQEEVASLSYRAVLDGFATILVHTVTPSGLSNQLRLADPGNQCSSAVSLVRGGQLFAAYRDDITSDPVQHKTVVDVLDAERTRVSHVVYESSEIGAPQQVVATTAGYLLHATDAAERNLLAFDDRGVLSGPAISIAGADLAQLVESTQLSQPLLARASGGNIELVVLAPDGTLGPSRVVVSQAGQVKVLATRETPTGTLVLWQNDQLFVSRTTASASEPVVIEVDGVNVTARAIAQGTAGPIVYVERDVDGGREIAAVQVCDL